METYQIRISDGASFCDVEIDGESIEDACCAALDAVQQDPCEFIWESFEGGEFFVDTVTNPQGTLDAEVPVQYRRWAEQRIAELEAEVRRLSSPTTVTS